MTRCANDHAPIDHDEFHCPLCAVLEDAIADGDRAAHFEQLLDEIEAADVLHLIAEIDATSTRAYHAETQLRRLRGIIEHNRPTPMHAYIAAVKRAAADSYQEDTTR